MIIEENYLKNWVTSYIDDQNKILENKKPSNEQEYRSFKSYLKIDKNNNFIIFDKENYIKCLFNQKKLNEYFSFIPSNNTLNDFSNSLIFLHKAKLDLLFYERLDQKISLNIVLIIEDFELDQVQKLNNEIYKKDHKNINFLTDIQQSLQNFYFAYVKNRIDVDNSITQNIEEHLNIDAADFLFKADGGTSNFLSDFVNSNKIFSKTDNCWLLSNEDINKYMDKNSYKFYEFPINFEGDEDTFLNKTDGLTKLQSIDFNKLFYSKKKSHTDTNNFLKKKREKDKKEESPEEKAEDKTINIKNLSNSKEEEKTPIAKLPTILRVLEQRLKTNNIVITKENVEQYKTFKNLDNYNYFND